MNNTKIPGPHKIGDLNLAINAMVQYVKSINPECQVKAYWTPKYVRVVLRKNEIEHPYAFVVGTDSDEKFKLGDILHFKHKSAPLRNMARGNVFTDLSKLGKTSPRLLASSSLIYD